MACLALHTAYVAILLCTRDRDAPSDGTCKSEYNFAHTPRPALWTPRQVEPVGGAVDNNVAFAAGALY